MLPLCSQCLVLALAMAGAPAPAFEPPQDQPALATTLAASSPLLGVAQAGPRIVAVGLRGAIVYSDDGGRAWKQAQVPVSSDLLAVAFPTPLRGYAVGHGGVVLASLDGGATWQRRLEGRAAAALVQRHYATRSETDPKLAALRKREQSLAADGGTQALLDLHFESETHGWVVGTFNRIYRTEDGGVTWTPWMERTDNPRELHFYAIRGDAQGTYLAGEQGMVWRLDTATRRFAAVPTPYKGTLFGVIGDGAGTLLAYGMRGSLFRSEDQGRSWAAVSGLGPAGINAAAVLPDGAIVLVNQAGGIDVSRDRGRSFAPLRSAQPMPYFGVAALGAQQVGLVGAAGVRLETIAHDSVK